MSGASGQAQVWQCGNQQLETVSTGSTLWLSLNERERELPRVSSASGEKYQDDALLVWLKGDEALVEHYGRRWPACQLDRAGSIWAQARLAGMTFRGVGNEPGWVLEIWPDRVRYLGDYGMTERSWPLPEPEITKDGTRYALGPEQWLILRQADCQDTMKGETFEASVALHLDQRLLQGCGRNLSGVPLP